MNRTKIEWADYTWNPVTGCWGPGGTAMKPSRCWYCYANRMAQRFSPFEKIGYQQLKMQCKNNDPFQPLFWPNRSKEPGHLKKPSKIFVCSMGDLFGDWVPISWIGKVFDHAILNKRHTFIFLTKNPARYAEFNPWPQNCWLGTTVTNQENADERIPLLLIAQASVLFVSVEPMLGPITLNYLHYDGFVEIDALNGTHGLIRPHRGRNAKLNWLIIGALSGPAAKQHLPRPEWVQALIDHARAAQVPILLKNNLHWPETIREWPEMS